MAIVQRRDVDLIVRRIRMIQHVGDVGQVAVALNGQLRLAHVLPEVRDASVNRGDD